MSSRSIVVRAKALCERMIADPALDSLQKSMAKQLLALVESVARDSHGDRYYDDFIRFLAKDISGHAL